MDRVKLCYVKGCLNAQTNGRRNTFFNFPSKRKRNGSQKSDEYLRLLQLKSGAGRTGLVNVSDTCRVVICLDLAAACLGLTFEKAEAQVLAGVNKTVYRQTRHNVEKLLGLTKNVTISDLTVRLGCTEVCELAQSIIDRYVSDHYEGKLKNQPIDLDHPMYYCAAVLAACKHRKVKIKRENLIKLCCVRAMDLDKLAANFLKLAAEVEVKRKSNLKRGHHLIDLVEEMVKDSNKKSVNGNDDDNKEEKESYDDWKKRILEEATSK